MNLKSSLHTLIGAALLASTLFTTTPASAANSADCVSAQFLSACVNVQTGSNSGSSGGTGGVGGSSVSTTVGVGRSTFVQNIGKVYRDYVLDGIDIDWEYPGRQADGD